MSKLRKLPRCRHCPARTRKEECSRCTRRYCRTCEGDEDVPEEVLCGRCIVAELEQVREAIRRIEVVFRVISFEQLLAEHQQQQQQQNGGHDAGTTR